MGNINALLEALDEQEPDRKRDPGGDEKKPDSGVVPPIGQGHDDFPNVAPESHNDGEQGAEVEEEGHGECVLGGQVHPLEEEQNVAAAGDREPLRDPLDHPNKERQHRVHRGTSLSSGIVRVCPLGPRSRDGGSIQTAFQEQFQVGHAFQVLEVQGVH